MMIKKIFLGLNVFLAAVFILIGLGVIRSFSKVNIETPREAIDDEQVLIPEHEVKPLSHYSLVIGQRALFGTPPPEEEVVALPRADLRLRLKGTIYGDPSSYAIIEDLTTRRQGLYRVGDMVSGVRIVRIERNQVVIEREGREEVLVSHWEGMLAQRQPDEAPALLALQPLEPAPIHIQPTEPPPIYTQPGVQPVLGEREMAAATEAAGKIMEKLHIDLRNIREIPANIMEAFSAANEVLANARIRPHFDGGRLRGIRVAEIRPGSIYERVGLRSGDVIKTINGHRVNSIRGVLRIYNEVRRQPVVTISIDRGGQTVTLVHRISPGG